MKYLLGDKFITNKDFELRSFEFNWCDIKEGAECEIIEIDETEEEYPYKVIIDNYDPCWCWFSEEELNEDFIKRVS